MVATPKERMNLEQKAKILMEENTVSTMEFFPSKNTMQLFHGGYPDSTAD
jgi:hypothetical protein